METVKFTKMEDGTHEEYEFLGKLEREHVRLLPERLLSSFETLKNSFGGYQVSRYEHSLQSATRAHQNGEDEEMVVAALLHDIGDDLAPYTHSEFIAAIFRPYVSEKTHWILKHHGLFQMVYYAHHLGKDRNARDRHNNHPYYQATVHFCEHYDQNCFDPEFKSLPIEFFAPMVHRVFSREPREAYTELGEA